MSTLAPITATGATGKNIVMIHGAFAGAWCFDIFRAVFADRGWTVAAPDLRGHGAAAGDEAALRGVGLADYRADLAGYLKGFAEPPVVLGHSMGGLLAQQLAADGLARALILVSPAPRAGILPTSDSEKAAAQGLIYLGPFWTTVVHPNFEVAAGDSLNRVPADRQRPLFDRFGPESGRALFELFFWMLDRDGASRVDTAAIRCPVLCLSGGDDRVVSPATAQATVTGLADARLQVTPAHGHMLLLEPGADALATDLAAWAERI